jgi:hypothetical protein
VPTCLGLGAISLALADPPAPSPSPTTAAPAADVPAAAPAATAAPPAATAAPPAAAGTPPAAAQATSSAPATGPTVDQYEKHFLAEGYKLEMHNGQKLFCRTEEIVGSRLGGQRVCATLEQLRATETDTRESIERWQRTSPSPTGH